MKNVYITWHYTTHGVAYLKHILSKFYEFGHLSSHIGFDALEQEKLNLAFNSQNPNGFLFDEIIYLTAPQQAFDGISSRRFSHRQTVLDDSVIKNSKLKKIYSELLVLFSVHNLTDELNFVSKKYPKDLAEYKELLWRNIQHYPINDQLFWLENYSNFSNVYSKKLKIVQLPVNDLRNEKQISDEVSRWVKKKFENDKEYQPIINVSLGSNETQVVWHILSEAGLLPLNTRFIKTYDDKADNHENRFKRFSIQEIPTNLVSSIGAELKIFNGTKSPSRKLVDLKLRTFLESGFSILLIGERGIGKSRVASNAKRKFDQKNPFIETNCASFTDDDKAESELFGYASGTFTGGLKEGKKGLLEEANGGILFLDEIHHLSPFVQAKLMKALQTDESNRMAVRRMGSVLEVKIECRLIFATNKSVMELQKILLPDFYDRIVQHVINIPSLRQTIEDRFTDWENVWKHQRFKGTPMLPTEQDLINWIKILPLYGNYRDLQKIAIYYNAFNQFDDETKNLMNERSAFQYAKSEFEKYHSLVTDSEKTRYNFKINLTTKQMILDYKYELQKWAVEKFKTRKAAIEHFRYLGDTVSVEAFNDWKNKQTSSSNKLS